MRFAGCGTDSQCCSRDETYLNSPINLFNLTVRDKRCHCHFPPDKATPSVNKCPQINLSPKLHATPSQPVSFPPTSALGSMCPLPGYCSPVLYPLSPASGGMAMQRLLTQVEDLRVMVQGRGLPQAPCRKGGGWAHFPDHMAASPLAAFKTFFGPPEAGPWTTLHDSGVCPEGPRAGPPRPPHPRQPPARGPPASLATEVLPIGPWCRGCGIVNQPTLINHIS